MKGEVPPVGKLLRTILRRPELADHIRSVALAGATFYREYPCNIPDRIAVSEVELELSVGFVRKINIPRGDDWIQGLRDRVMGAFIAVLLSQLTNLTYLDIGPNFAKDTPFLGVLFRSALCMSSASVLPKF